MSERSYCHSVYQVVRARCRTSVQLQQSHHAVFRVGFQEHVHSDPKAGLGNADILQRMAYVDHVGASAGPIFEFFQSSHRIASESCGSCAEPEDARASPHKKEPLIVELYDRYCESLVSPLTATSNNWVGADDAKFRDRGQAEILKDNSNTPVASILGDINTTEEAFGRLDRSEFPVSSETVPEILSLFAPPEYQISSARRPPATPPELAKREHHAVSLDSPMW